MRAPMCLQWRGRRRTVVVAVIIAIAVRSRRNGAQGEQADSQAEQGPAIAAAVPAAAIATAVTAMAVPAMAAAIALRGSSGGAQQGQDKSSRNQAFHGFDPFKSGAKPASLRRTMTGRP